MKLSPEIKQKKIDLNDFYNLSDPKHYYKFITQYEYDLPERAQPYFMKLVNAYRYLESVHSLKILDIGCSYGINSALLKFDQTIAKLDQHYSDPTRNRLTESARRHQLMKKNQ